MADLIEKGLSAKRESKRVEFKASFDPGSDRDWVEIVKDIVAIANSGGGVIIFGLDNRGNPSRFDVTPMLAIDPADWTNKIARYTDVEFSGFEIVETHKAGTKLCVVKVDPALPPMVFTKPGTYIVDATKQKQKNAFSLGTVYFRHGAKSEPCNRDDLDRAIQEQLNSIRKAWLKDVRKVVNAPPGYEVKVLPPEVTESTSPHATPIRLTDDPNAPSYRMINPDISYPFRQKEVIAAVSKELPSDVTINQYDILVVRRIWNIDAQKKFFYRSKFGSPQYSKAFVEWLVKQYKNDPQFFTNTRRTYYQQLHGAPKKR